MSFLDLSRGWWLEEQPTAVVADCGGYPVGLLTVIVNWRQLGDLVLPVMRDFRFRPHAEPLLYASMPLLHFRRVSASHLGLPVVEVRGYDGATEDDPAPGYWPFLPPLPHPALLVAIEQAQQATAMRKLLKHAALLRSLAR